MEPTIVKQNAAYRGAPESRKYIEFVMELLHDIKALAWMMDGDDASRKGHTQTIQENMEGVIKDGVGVNALNDMTTEFEAFKPYDTVRQNLNAVEARLRHLRRLTV